MGDLLLLGRVLKKLAQGDCLVVLLAPGAVEQCDGTLACQRQKFMEWLLALRSSKLRVVTPLEFLPAPRIMPEPLAQLIGGSKFVEPEVKLESVLPDSTGPNSVNQDSSAASPGFSGVDALELDFQQETVLPRARLRHSHPRLAPALGRQILDLPAWRTAAVPSLTRMFRPSPTVAAPTLAVSGRAAISNLATRPWGAVKSIGLETELATVNRARNRPLSEVLGAFNSPFRPSCAD